MKSSAVLRIEIVLLASYKILLDFARVHATTLLQLGELASRTIEIISNGPKFLVGDLQLNLNLQCVVMKNDEEGLIILLKKAAESIIYIILIWEKRRLCVIVQIGWINVGFWRSNLDAHFFIWDKKDVVYTIRIGLIKDGFWWSNLWVSNWVF